MFECASVSRAADPKRPAAVSAPFPSEPQTWIAAVIDSNPLLCRPRVRAPQHAATNSVGGAEETFRRVPALLSRGSQTAPICSPVSSHAALAKCQGTEYVDRFGHRFRIPVHGPVCENAAPRFGSSEAIDDNAMEQWPYLRTHQPAKSDQAANVWAGRFRAAKSASAALECFKSSVTPAPKVRKIRFKCSKPTPFPTFSVFSAARQ